MTAGEILLLVISFLVPFIVVLPFYALELLIGFIQALIFAGLTLVFGVIALTPHSEEEHTHKEETT
jgi:F-type H+-transporting ATPase subunit a